MTFVICMKVLLLLDVADGIHDALDSPFIVGRKVRDTIFNTISRVPFPEASEGTFAVPSLLQRAKAEGMTLPIVEGLHECIIWRGFQQSYNEAYSGVCRKY